MQPLAPALLVSPDDMNFDSERYPTPFLCVCMCDNNNSTKKYSAGIGQRIVPIPLSDANFHSVLAVMTITGQWLASRPMVHIG